MASAATRSALLAIAVAVAAAVVWLVFAVGSVGTETPAAVVPSVAAMPSPAQAVADPAADADTVAAALELLGGDPRREVAGEAAIPPVDATTPDVIEIALVDRDSGAPVLGAEVFGGADLDIAALSDAERQRIARLARDREVLVRTLGGRLHPDERGIVRIPRPKLAAGVVARTGERYGELFLSSWAPGPFVLEMVDDWSLRLRVVDAQGRAAAGVPIGWVVASAGRTGRGARLGETDERGELVVPHARQQIAAAAGERGVLRVAPDLPGLGSVGPEIDRTVPPRQPIEIVLPPTGAIELVLPAPQAAAAHVELSAVGSSESFDRELDAAADGRITFATVALGMRWRINGRVWRAPGAGQPWPLVTAEVRGPTRPGETVRVELTRTAQPVLLGRVLDAQRAPIVQASVVATLRWPDGEVRTNGSTDAAGVLELVLPPTGVRRVVHELCLHVAATAATPPCRAVVPLRLELRNGVNAFGDVVLRTPRPLAAGQVVDDLGRGVRANVHVEQAQSDAQGNQTWIGARDLVAECAADGRFAVLGESGAWGLRLRVGALGYSSPPPYEFRAGQHELRIVMVRAATIAASVLIDPDLPLSWLSFELAREGDQGAEQAAQRIGGGRAQVAWHGIAAGTYRLTARARGVREPLLVVDGLAVHPGEVGRDSRLQPIDLRGRLRVVTVTVRDPSGQVLDRDDGGVFVRGDDPTVSHGEIIAAGAARVAFTAPSADLILSVPGFRTEELRGVSNDIDVRLRPALEVRFTVRGTPTDGDLALLVERLPVEAIRYNLWSPSILARKSRIPHADKGLAMREADGTFATGLGAPGRYQVQACECRPGQWPRPRRDVPPQTVEVRDVAGAQQIEVVFTRG